jgi:phosphoribosylformylglycinamidine cyclo-ligase
MKKSAYSAAGVNIDEKMAGLDAIKKMVNATATSGAISGIGPFGGMFKSPGAGKILVASTDGVGTKLKVATLCGRYDTVGQDIVNHCVNDILVQGATPLFFMDYFAASRIERGMLAQVISGMCKACRENNCTLLGGETAEMPGVYAKGECDVVGTIVGMVDRKEVITGGKIRAGDVIIGLPSSGLHTNGYSLARKALLKTAGLKVSDKLPGSDVSVGEALLAVHRSYLKPITALIEKVAVHGMAHLTGGGFPDNIPRVLPRNVNAIIDRAAWRVPPVFSLIQKFGKVDRDEMYRVFNMGIGYVVMLSAKDVNKAMSILRSKGTKPVVVGRIENGQRKVIMMG